LRGRVAIVRGAWPALALGVLLVAIVPPALFGVGYVSDRMPLFLAFVAVAALATSGRPWSRLEGGALAAIAVLVAVKVAAIGYAWSAYATDFQHFRSAGRSIPTHSVVGFVNLANGERLDPGRRCEMYGPLLIPLQGDATPVFALGSAQPIAVIGRLDAASRSPSASTEARRGRARAHDRLSNIIRNGQYDYVLVCGGGPPSDRPGASLVAQSGRFAVYRLAAAGS